MMAKKRILSWLVAASLALSLLPTALAVHDEDKILADNLQSQAEATDSKKKADDAERTAETAKEDAETAETATKNESLTAVVEAEKIYESSTEGVTEAVESIVTANGEIDKIVTDTNAEVGTLNESAADALTKAQEAVEAATADGSDVKKAQEAAEAAKVAVDAATEVLASEDATNDEKRKAANAAKKAANLANQAVETAQETLNAANQEVEDAQTAYTQAKEAYDILIGNATGDVKEILDGNSAAAQKIKDVNENLKKAQDALAAAEGKAVDAQKAADKAAESAAAANKALADANAKAISEKLGNVDIILPEEDEYDVNSYGTEIDNAKNQTVSAATETFEKTFLEKCYQLQLESSKKENMAALRDLEISTDTLNELQAKLNKARDDREQASLGHKVENMIDYDDVIREIAKTLGLKDLDMGGIAATQHVIIRNLFQAKTTYELAKENATKYADAAKAVVAAQDAKKAAEAAKANADEALKNYNDAKTALENAKAIEATLKDAKFAELNDLQADLTAAQAKLTAAQLELNEANQKAEDADKAAQDILDQLPPEDDGDDTTITDPTTPGTGDTDDTDDDDGATILDDAVPLALMPTRGELMNYLYVRAGSPEAAPATFTDVPADHEFAQAIGWAQANGIAVAYEDGTFDPDNFVIAADMVTFLESYAKVAGMTVTFPLAAMAGLEDDAIVENADDILSEFFGD